MTTRVFRTIVALAVLHCLALAQAGSPLDPTRNLPVPRASTHTPLPEQYIWTRGGPPVAQGDIQPRYFRVAFNLPAVPPAATLYLAGPRSAKIYLNGKLVDRFDSDLTTPRLDFHVFATPVAVALRPGRNVLSLEVVRGKGGSKATDVQSTIQIASGEVVVAKILPAAAWIPAKSPALLLSDTAWKATLTASGDWQSPAYDDSAWPTVTTLGPIESDINLRQWDADAGMYNWPGYQGVSPFLRQTPLAAVAVTHVFSGRSTIENADALTKPGSTQLTVRLSSPKLLEQNAPSLVLDFGQETVGRLQLVSTSATPATVSIAYGESEGELLNQPYLGTDLLTLPPHATAYGPKSAFRYARVRFLAAQGPIQIRSIQLDAIYYPVTYSGSFESSDPLLNKIWETGAYTAHLCMQDDIWDAPKRDRGRWAGDLDVSGRVIDDVFADRFLMQDTLTRLLDDRAGQNVNSIPGYSALWIDALMQYYLHTGSLDYLKSVHQQLLDLLAVMDSEMDADHLFADTSKQWPFVDWSPDLSADTPEARSGTQFEDILAFHDAAYLLRELGDNTAAAKRDEAAAQLTTAAQGHLLDTASGTFGSRWQVNSMAILSGAATPAQVPAIWSTVLTHTADASFREPPITPFYNYYVISAMAATGHRAEALAWIRKYWGGMIDEGATSFWEAYDTHWPTQNPHVSLQADGSTGYFVSLAHGWSSGPTAWLMEEILGVRPTGAGFRTATLRPDLAGLAWARGAVPTPHGPITVDLKPAQTTVTVPAGVELSVLVPISPGHGSILLNGKAVQPGPLSEDGTRATVVLTQPGTYTLETQ